MRNVHVSEDGHQVGTVQCKRTGLRPERMMSLGCWSDYTDKDTLDEILGKRFDSVLKTTQLITAGIGRLSVHRESVPGQGLPLSIEALTCVPQQQREWTVEGRRPWWGR